jgi:hypothetical protein
MLYVALLLIVVLSLTYACSLAASTKQTEAKQLSLMGIPQSDYVNL